MTATHEVSREIFGDEVVITYDDGTVKKIPLPTIQVDLQVDADNSAPLNKGHVIKND